MIATQTRRYTAEDYAALPEGAPFQLINGELVMSPAPTFPHQIAIGNLFDALRQYFRAHPNGNVYPSPLDVHIDDTNIPQPDLVVILHGNKGRAERDGFYGAPDLVIEVLSPSNAYRDLVEKKAIYEQSGVREYWIVDPDNHYIECLCKSATGFVLHSIARKEGVVSSSLLEGFSIELKDVFTEK